ncbi:MAG: toxin-antitoxin system YwqK family antitoxin [Bacteroidales bacterium]|nr:toxin-antitoxin system YwqK family antitoxin [Bacteroidales bacterium]
MRTFLLGFLVFICAVANSQPDTLFNQTDANKLKQGWWKKAYPNGKLMYKGFFRDDKPVGTMYRYFENGAVKAILIYDAKSEYARARLLYEDGNLAAEGVFYNSLKDSTWSYYSYYDRSLTATENYQKGLRHGRMTNYYNNGIVSEILDWKNDKKHGVWEQYFPSGKLKMKGSYVDQKLEGDFLVNYDNGKPYLQGYYVNDRRQGKWTFFTENGTVEAEMEYVNGTPLNEDQLTEKQQELFRTIDANEGKFEEPDESNFLIPQGR